MVKEKLLTELVHEAGFYNIHSFPASFCAAPINFIFSDEYESLYYKFTKSGKTDDAELDIFGIKQPLDHENCAIYRIRARDLKKWSHHHGINIDKVKSLYKGEIAVNLLKGYIEQNKKDKTK